MIETLTQEHELLAVIRETSALLGHAEVEHWPVWLDRIAEEVSLRDRGAITRLLSGFGGMGSFNDLYLCSHNGHRVARTEEAAVNEHFDSLRSEIYKRATQIASS